MSARAASPSRRWLGFTKREHLTAVAIFAAVTIAFFLPLFRGDTFGDIRARQHGEYPWAGALPNQPGGAVLHFDQDDTFYPWQVFMSRALHHGQFPLWDPYSFGGTPFFANGQSGVLYPPRLALSFVVSAARVHDLLLLTHFLLAGVAMFLLLGFVGRSFPAAVVGGLAWMLNSFALAWQALEHYVAVEVWLPVGVLLAHAVVRRKSWPAAFLLALALSLLFVGGNVLFVELAIVVILGYALTLLLAEAVANRRAAAAGVARVVTAVLLFVGMTLVSILPTLDLTRESARVSLTYGELHQFAMSWRTLENIFKPPLAAGDPAYHQALFAGTAIGFLALIGVASRSILSRFALVTAVLTILFMLHTPVTYIVVHVLPGFQNFKPLGRAAFVVQFCLAVLAAFGLDVVLAGLVRLRPPRLPFRFVFGGTVGAGAGVVVERFAKVRFGLPEGIAIAIAVAGAAAVALDAAGRAVDRRTGRRIAGSGLSAGLAAGAILGILLESLARPKFPSRAALAFALVLVLAIAIVYELTEGKRVRALRPPAAASSRMRNRVALALAVVISLSVVTQAQGWATFVMPHQPAGARDLYPSTPLIRFIQAHSGARFLPTGPTLYGSTSMIFGLHNGGGYESLLPRRVQNFWRVMGEGIPVDELASHRLIYAYDPVFDFATIKPRLLKRAAVSYVVAPPTATGRTPAGLQLRYHGPDGRVFAVQDAQPLAYLVSGCEEVATAADALRRVAASDFRPRDAVILEHGAHTGACSNGPAGAAGTAVIRTRTLNTLVVAVQASRPAWLVVAESWDRGWRATVDGHSTEVDPANYVFRAVRVGSGFHIVRFRYKPRPLELGAVVSSLSLMFTLGALFAPALLRRRRESRPSATRTAVNAAAISPQQSGKSHDVHHGS